MRKRTLSLALAISMAAMSLAGCGGGGTTTATTAAAGGETKAAESEAATEAAKTDDARLLRETDNKLFLRMFLKYLQKNHHKIYLLAASQEELVKAEEALARYNQGIRVVGDAVIHPEDGELTDADRIHGIVNAVNGSEADCILSVLPSPVQEDFIEQNRALIDTRVWIGCGSVLMRSFDDRKMTSRIKRMLVKKVFRYKVEKQN